MIKAIGCFKGQMFKQLSNIHLHWLSMLATHHKEEGLSEKSLQKYQNNLNFLQN